MGNPLVFIIEDHEDAATIFSEALKAADFETEIIRSGDVALKRLSEAVPEMVILDLNLPRERRFCPGYALTNGWRVPVSSSPLHIPNWPMAFKGTLTWCFSSRLASLSYVVWLYAWLPPVPSRSSSHSILQVARR